MRLATLEILIADDHEAMRALLQSVLARAGAECVRAARDTAQALSMLAERPADLVIADCQMPGASGLDFIAAIRAEPRYGAPRILMLTGRGDIAEAARAAGADALLVKPVSPRALLETIAALF